MAKTSNELLESILGVLVKVDQKLDKSSGKTESPSVKVGAAGVFASMIGKKGVAAKMAEDIDKLKTSMKGLNLTRLNKLNESMNQYIKNSKESSKASRVSSWALAAQDMGKALMFIAGGIGMFAGVIAISAGVLGITPLGIFGFILGTFATLSFSMMMLSAADASGDLIGGVLSSTKSLKNIKGGNIKADKGRSKGAIENAKDMGLALMFIAGGVLAFATTMGLIAGVLGVGGALLVPVAIAGMLIMLAGTMVIMSAITDFEFGGIGKTKKGKGTKSKDAIQNAKDMGIALMFIAGGVLAFSISIALVPMILKANSILGGIGIVVGIIAGMSLIFMGLGFLDKSGMITAGTKAAKGISFGMMLLSLGVLAVAGVSKLLMMMGDKDATKKDGTQRGKFGQIMSGIGPGLGLFGIFVASAIGLFWLVGLPMVSAPIMLGAGALILLATSLILTTVAIKKIVKTMDGMDVKVLKTNIKDMVGGVMGGVIEGVMGSGIDKGNADGSGDGNLSLREIRQFRRVTRVIKMLGTVSSSLSKFAQGLKAFAKLGEIASLEYEYDENGNVIKPKIGEKIHVKSIAQSIADTFGLFLKTLVTNTEGMTRREARSLKILGKALTGDRGIISGVSQFANTLKTFAEFGSKGEIYVPEVKDENGKVVKAAEHVKIGIITQHIVDSFGEFVSQMAAKAPLFEMGGAVGKKMVRFTEALMGSSKGFLKREKQGILSAITSFNDVILAYADYGANGEIPRKDKDGQIIAGKPIKISEVAKNMISGIDIFVTELDTQLKGKNLEASSKSIKNKIESFTDIITNFDKLAQSQEGVEKLANSMGLLGTNVGLLVTNMDKLNLDNLNKLTTITAQHAVTTKGVPISDTTKTTSSSNSFSSSSMSQPDWDKIGDIIGQKVAEKLSFLRSGEFGFHFYNNTGGKLELTEK